MNVVYSYFISHPSELRHDVRENFEEFLTGVEIPKGATDDRPIIEQAAGMMDQLSAMEDLLGVNTFTDIVQAAGSAPPEALD